MVVAGGALISGAESIVLQGTESGFENINCGDVAIETIMVGLFIPDLLKGKEPRLTKHIPKDPKMLVFTRNFVTRKEYDYGKYITKNGIKYEFRGEQYYPMLEISEQTNYEIGKYGHLHLAFIKKHRRGTYTILLTEGRLNEHLHIIDEQAHEQIDLHIAQMAEHMGVTEELKASDPMRWVQMMNNIKASAEEIVLKEVVYK